MCYRDTVGCVTEKKQLARTKLVPNVFAEQIYKENSAENMANSYASELKYNIEQQRQN